jgi:hypothetical protein
VAVFEARAVHVFFESFGIPLFREL